MTNGVRICDQCPEHEVVKRVQADRTEIIKELKEMNAAQWNDIKEAKAKAEKAMTEASKKVTPGQALSGAVILVMVILAMFGILFTQNSVISTKMSTVAKDLAVVTALAEKAGILPERHGK